MALFGSGIQNGSPFYAGYEVSLPEAPKQPTAFSSLANLLLKGKVGTEATDGTTSSTDKTKIGSTYVAGTDGTRSTIVSNLNTIDAGIASIKAKMRQQFDRKTNPTTEKAIASITALGLDKQLGELIAARNNVKSVISQANQDKINLDAIDEAYKGENQSALSETAVQKIGGVFVGTGLNDEGNFLNYGDLKTAYQKADNTVTDANGLVKGVKYTDYSPLTMGVSQRGALSKKITEILDKSKDSTIEDSSDIISSIGTINTYGSSSNEKAVLNAANNIRDLLDDSQKADLAAQTMDFVKQNKNQTLLDENEVNAVKKSYTAPKTLTAEDLETVIKAQNKVLASIATGQTDSYIKSKSISGIKEGLYGQGKYKTKETFTINPESTSFKVQQVAKDGSAIPDKYDVYTTDNTKYWNITQADPKKEITISISRDTDLFDAVTGEKQPIDEQNTGNYRIDAYEEVTSKSGAKYPYVIISKDIFKSDGSFSKSITYRTSATRQALSTLKTKTKEGVISLENSSIFNDVGYGDATDKNVKDSDSKTTTTNNKSYTTKDGKSYNYDDLLKMGYTDDQIKQAVNLGNLK